MLYGDNNQEFEQLIHQLVNHRLPNLSMAVLEQLRKKYYKLVKLKSVYQAVLELYDHQVYAKLQNSLRRS